MYSQLIFSLLNIPVSNHHLLNNTFVLKIHLELDIDSGCGKNVADGINKDGSYHSSIRDEVVHATIRDFGHIVKFAAIKVVSESKGMDWNRKLLLSDKVL